jgi:hypothetical protein
MFLLTGIRGGALPLHGYGDVVAQAQDQPKQEPTRSRVFTGTIIKDGEMFVLRDSAGGVFKLDNSEQAQQFEGKAVKVTGKLDTEAKLIHVESIEAATA